MQYEDLLATWQARQERLSELLAEHGATDCEYRIDLSKNQFLWVHPDGTAALAAETRKLLSYAFSDRSILMSWANPSVPRKAAIARQPGVPSRIEDASETDAWTVAMTLGLAVDAHFLYRAPTAQNLAFFGLWNVRPGTAADRFRAPFQSGYVRSLLRALREVLEEGRRDPAVVKRLFENQGRTLVTRAEGLDNGHRLAPLEKSTGEALIEIGTAMSASRRATPKRVRSWLEVLEGLEREWKPRRRKRSS